MSDRSAEARRAYRLLCWYPPTWRQRYGDEFVDHLEQEFAERHVDRRRSLNIAYKGLVARVGDLGFSPEVPSTGVQTREALGTSFAVVTAMSVLIVNFWSLAMLNWSSRTYHPVPIDITTGILTAAAGILGLIILATVLVVAGSTARQILGGRGRPIAVPSGFAAGSAAFILYQLRGLPSALALYSHLRPSGFRWTHPGPAAYGVAYILRITTQPWVSIWNPGITGVSTSQTVMTDLVPLALIVFAVAMAFLIRRVDLPRVSERTSSAAMVMLGSITGVFLFTIVVWLTVGGPSDFPTFGSSGDIAGVTYLVLFALVSSLVASLGLRLSRGGHPRIGVSDVSCYAP